MTAPRYRRAREIAGLSIAQAAKLLGAGDDLLSAMERELWHPDDVTIRLLTEMAAIYGCSLEWLRGDHVELSPSVKDLLACVGELSFADRDALDEMLRSMGR